MKKNDIICWWSGGVTSAVACYIAIAIYGIARCRFIMMDTMNKEDENLYGILKEESYFELEI